MALLYLGSVLAASQYMPSLSLAWSTGIGSPQMSEALCLLLFPVWGPSSQPRVGSLCSVHSAIPSQHSLMLLSLKGRLLLLLSPTHIQGSVIFLSRSWCLVDQSGHWILWSLWCRLFTLTFNCIGSCTSAQLFHVFATTAMSLLWEGTKPCCVAAFEPHL